MYTDADRRDAYHLLALAESGRPAEQIAQFFASMVQTGDLDCWDISNLLGQIFTRAADLMSDNEASNEIWEHLLPGGSQGDPLMHEDTQRLHHIVDIVGSEPDTKDETVVLMLHAFFKDQGLISDAPIASRKAPDPDPPGTFPTIVVANNDQGWLVVSESGHLYKTTEYIRYAPNGSGEVGETLYVQSDDLISVDGSEVSEFLN